MCWKSNMKMVWDFRLMAGQLFKESHYHKHFGQWQDSFQLKAALPLVKRLAVASCRLSCAGWMILRTEASVIHGRPTSTYMVLSCSTQMVNNVIRKHFGFPLCARAPYKHPGTAIRLFCLHPIHPNLSCSQGWGRPQRIMLYTVMTTIPIYLRRGVWHDHTAVSPRDIYWLNAFCVGIYIYIYI